MHRYIRPAWLADDAFTASVALEQAALAPTLFRR
jgi:hypothetical protein